MGKAYKMATMPVRYDVDHDARRVTIVLTPPVETAEIVALLERRAADGAWPYAVLYDMRALPQDRSRISTLLETARGLTAIHGPSGPVAIVASAPAIGEAQAYSILGRSGIEVFWDRDEATRWLDERQ
jgi:hypothetical protein